MEITKDTRLADLIAQYPWLKTEMAKVNEKFKMLNTPVGKIMLGKATITEMSKKSGMEVEAIIEKIKGLINQHINQLFSIQGDVAVAIEGEVPESALAAAAEAKEGCPVGAIEEA